MMKKTMLVICLVLLCVVCCLPVGAAEGESGEGAFATAADLFNHWEQHGYPDYIGGIWTDNGTDYPLTFGLADEAGREEVLRLLADDRSVVFTSLRYSRNELMRLQDSLFVCFEQDLGLSSMGVMERENVLEIGILSDRLEDARTMAWIDTLYREYGDMVRIVSSEGYVAMTIDIPTVGTGEGSSVLTQEVRMRERWIRLLSLSGAVLLCAVATLLILRRRAVAVQTTTGEQIRAVGGKPSRRRVEKALKESECAPDASLEKRIFSKFR